MSTSNGQTAEDCMNLPVKTDPDTFLAEVECMNLDDLKGRSFVVALSRDDPQKGKFICTTMRGPYDFYEMCEEVGTMWREHQHHAKVYILEKSREKRSTWLDKNTSDYIECHYADIITEGLLEGVFDADKQYTCKANIIEDNEDDNPLKKDDSTTEQITSP